ncbi:MAG: LysM peptidoglycan-binding domain-containing protein [Crocinitomicaceae bacterium]
MKKLILILFVLLSVVANAQPEDAVTKTIEGKKYYVHTVQAGNTLYGIHQLYKTDLNEILSANPGLNDNLSIGQQVLIPIPLDDKSHYGDHVVIEGETLYGLSKKYNCSVDDLKKLNPGIESGLQIGQIVKTPKSKNVNPEIIQSDPEIVALPEYEISLSDSIVMHTVLAHETMYSISKRYMVSADTIMVLNGMRNSRLKKGDQIKIPVKKVNYEVLDKVIEPVKLDSSVSSWQEEKKEVYSVALMLPFMFAKNDVEMSKTLKLGQHREMYPTTQIAFEFYQGFKFAMDSLKKAGLSVKLYVYDTKKDTAEVGRIFAKSEFSQMDLVVGPLYPKTVEYAAKLCKEKELNIVLPFKVDAKVLHENQNAFKTVSSNMTLMDGTVDYILENHALHNVVILKPYLEGDKALYDRARDRFNAGVVNIASYNSMISELSLGSSSGRDLNGQLKKDTVNVVIVPSNDVKFVTGALNRLNKVLNFNPYAKKMKIIVFGFEDWNKFDDIDILHRNRMNQHYATYRFVDYNLEKNLGFVKHFRGVNGTDPTVYSSQGFDVGMYFLSALKLYGVNFQSASEVHQLSLIQNNFDFKRISPESGFENKDARIIQYKSFQLIDCEKR